MKDSILWALRQDRIRRFGANAGPFARVPREAPPGRYLVVAAKHVVVALRVKRRNVRYEMRAAQPDEARRLRRQILDLDKFLEQAKGVFEMAAQLEKRLRRADGERTRTVPAPTGRSVRAKATAKTAK